MIEDITLTLRAQITKARPCNLQALSESTHAAWCSLVVVEGAINFITLTRQAKDHSRTIFQTNGVYTLYNVTSVKTSLHRATLRLYVEALRRFAGLVSSSCSGGLSGSGD